MLDVNAEFIIQEALSDLQVYDNSYEFVNESNFKHELFHKISSKEYNSIRLSEAYPGSKTSIVHCEAKVENGIESSRKADLIFCNPLIKMAGVGKTFNYQVEVVCELKKRFMKEDFTKEIQKYIKYKKKINKYFFIEPYRSDMPPQDIINTLTDCNIKYITQQTKPIFAINYLSFNDSQNFIIEALEESLYLYGHYNSQFQSFYWCNYEHELNRGVTFPSEGDFNAHLYHRIKKKMPFAHVETEYNVGKNKRIDLVIFGPNNEWCIPIEVKMNWDQFKLKYKNGKQIEEEATTIISRFELLKARGFKKCTPILVIIQGDNYYSCHYPQGDSRNNKHRSLDIIRRKNKNLIIKSFNESQNKVGEPTKY